MSNPRRLGILLTVLACGLAACSSPAGPRAESAEGSLSQSPVPPEGQGGQTPTATDSTTTTARNGGNLMGGN